jgi:hypothetical protein
MAHRGGWRSIATTEDLKLRSCESRVKSFHGECSECHVAAIGLRSPVTFTRMQ